MMDKKESFYKKLRETLEETSSFPCAYLYKFIIPGGGGQLAELEKAFNDNEASFTVKPSRTGKYDSVSIKLTVSSAQEVIDLYQKVENIEGIISL